MKTEWAWGAPGLSLQWGKFWVEGERREEQSFALCSERIGAALSAGPQNGASDRIWVTEVVQWFYTGLNLATGYRYQVCAVVGWAAILSHIPTYICVCGKRIWVETMFWFTLVVSKKITWVFCGLIFPWDQWASSYPWKDLQSLFCGLYDCIVFHELVSLLCPGNLTNGANSGIWGIHRDKAQSLLEFKCTFPCLNGLLKSALEMHTSLWHVHLSKLIRLPVHAAVRQLFKARSGQ